MIRKLLKIAACSMAFLLACFLGAAVYFTQPWIIKKDVRATGKLETVRGQYGRECGEEFIAGYGKDERFGRLNLVVPPGGIAPDHTPAAVPDNVFVLTGYRYTTRQRNIFTGKVTEIPSPRFDVVAWHAVLPYRVFEDGEYKRVNTPLGWKNANAEPTFLASAPARGGC